MKNAIVTIVGVWMMIFFAGCGGGSTTGDSSSTVEGRLLTGAIESADVAAMVAKSESLDGTCIGEICSVVAYGDDGEQVEGAVDPLTNRWRIRVRSGNWMFAFLDGEGERLGYLALNGITALSIEDGDEIDVGCFRHRHGRVESLGDVENLGLRGIHSSFHRDLDFDGIPSELDDDEPAYDAAAFYVTMIRPFNAQVNVAPCRPIKVVFSEPLDETTVNGETVIVRQSDETVVEGTLSVWQDVEYGEYEIIFIPTDRYSVGETIELTLFSGPDGILSDEGASLEADIEVAFDVRDNDNASGICHDPDHERRRERTRRRERAGQGEN